MADPISFKEEASRLVERLATEIEGLFLLLSFLLGLDSFLYESDPQHRTFLQFDWSFAHGFNIGYILLFLALFSFTMTVVTPLVLSLIGLLRQLLIPVTVRIAEFFPGEKTDWAELGYVRTHKLRDLALSDKDHFYLLDLADKRDRADASAQASANKLGYLASALVVNAAISAVLGYSSHATFFWKVFDTPVSTNKYIQNAVILLGYCFCFVLLAFIRPLFMYNHRNYGWVYYPPLANEEMNDRERRRQELYVPPSRTPFQAHAPSQNPTSDIFGAPSQPRAPEPFHGKAD